MNLLLLTVDAWRPDFVDEFAGVRLLPPLAALEDRLVRFDRAWATAPWTSPAMISMFTGQSPTRHGVIHAWDRPRPGGPSLVGRLREAGFHAPNLCYLNRIDNYHHLGYAPEESLPPAKDPQDPRLLEALATTPEPFVLWYHYRFLHLPYWASPSCRRALGVEEVPEGLRETVGSLYVMPRSTVRLDPAWADPVRRLYAAGVLEFGGLLARVLEALERRGLQDRTTLVLTSDHGEELMEHGHAGHASTAWHATLFEEVLRVPLLVADPRVSTPRRIQARVQTSDLYRTLLSLAGAPDPSGEGADLAPAVVGDGEPDLPPDRIFRFHSSRRGFQTPEEMAGQAIEAYSDGRRKVTVERFDEVRAWEVDLEADPGEMSLGY